MALECTPRMIAGIYFHGHRDVHKRGKTPYSPTKRDLARHTLASLFLGAGDQHSVASADNYLRLLGVSDKAIRGYRSILDRQVGQYIHDLAMRGKGLTIQRGDEFYLGVRLNGESLSLSPEIEYMRDDFIDELKQGSADRKTVPTRGVETGSAPVPPIF